MPLRRSRQVPPGPVWGEALLLVALGAIPGALLRWFLQSDPFANLLGCLLIGLVQGLQPARPRLLLVVAIGLCGALTTFSGWILALANALAEGRTLVVALLLLESGAGVLVVPAGARLARLWQRR